MYEEDISEALVFNPIIEAIIAMGIILTSLFSCKYIIPPLFRKTDPEDTETDLISFERSLDFKDSQITDFLSVTKSTLVTNKPEEFSLEQFTSKSKAVKDAFANENEEEIYVD